MTSPGVPSPWVQASVLVLTWPIGVTTAAVPQAKTSAIFAGRSATTAGYERKRAERKRHIQAVLASTRWKSSFSE